MTRHKPATCTVSSAVTGACGEPAVWSNGKFAECATHAADAIALARPRTVAGKEVGDAVTVERHGKRYIGTVCRVGARGAIYAEVTYDNGATRVIRVFDRA